MTDKDGQAALKQSMALQDREAALAIKRTAVAWTVGTPFVLNGSGLAATLTADLPTSVVLTVANLGFWSGLLFALFAGAVVIQSADDAIENAEIYLGVRSSRGLASKRWRLSGSNYAAQVFAAISMVGFLVGAVAAMGVVDNKRVETAKSPVPVSQQAVPRH
jgi:hypothetical protein